MDNIKSGPTNFRCSIDWPWWQRLKSTTRHSGCRALHYPINRFYPRHRCLFGVASSLCLTRPALALPL